MSRHSLDLMRELLDHEVVDSEDVACGRVDDIELANLPGKGPIVTALLIGPGAWARRLPALLQWFAVHLCGKAIVRVPWEEVAEIGQSIRLRSTASALKLGRLDRKVGQWISHLPKS